MKKKLNKKQLSLLISLLLLLTVSVGGTLAYIVTQTTPVANTFIPAKVTCQINETFENDVKSNVTIENTGTTSAYIRATVIVTWKDKDGNIRSETPVLGEHYVLEMGSSDNWLKIGEYYYHKAPVAAEGEDDTEILINSCKLEDGVTPPEGYGLSVEIVADAIQAEGVDSKGNHPVELAWKVVTVDANNNLVGEIKGGRR